MNPNIGLPEYTITNVTHIVCTKKFSSTGQCIAADFRCVIGCLHILIMPWICPFTSCSYHRRWIGITTTTKTTTTTNATTTTKAILSNGPGGSRTPSLREPPISPCADFAHPWEAVIFPISLACPGPPSTLIRLWLLLQVLLIKLLLQIWRYCEKSVGLAQTVRCSFVSVL